jgi:hypothetical protein
MPSIPRATRKAVKSKSKRSASKAQRDVMLSQVFDGGPAGVTKVPAGIPVVALPDHTPAGGKRKK